MAYLCRNFQAAAELLAQGASPAARDIHRRTPVQLMNQKAPVSRRPWSGSAAAVVRRSRDGVVLDLPQMSAYSDRPFTGKSAMLTATSVWRYGREGEGQFYQGSKKSMNAHLSLEGGTLFVECASLFSLVV